MFCNTIETPDNFITGAFGHRVIIKWPNYVCFNSPDREYYPIRAAKKGNYVKFISGDPSLLKEAGDYYNELFRIQRKYQGLQRKEEIKYYQREEKRLNTKFYEWKLDGFYYCYPIHDWKEKGLRLKTRLEVMKWPFLPLYTRSPIGEADLGIAPDGHEMDKRIKEYRKLNREAPSLPSVNKQIDKLYKYTRYQFGIGRNVPTHMAKQYIHGHYYKPPGPYANIDTDLRHIDRFSQYNSSESDGEIFIEN